MIIIVLLVLLDLGRDTKILFVESYQYTIPKKIMERQNMIRKNIEMILDAAETVLGNFRFNRTIYGDRRSMTPRQWRWIQELREQRRKDIRTEIS